MKTLIKILAITLALSCSPSPARYKGNDGDDILKELRDRLKCTTVDHRICGCCNRGIAYGCANGNETSLQVMPCEHAQALGLDIFVSSYARDK